MIINHDSYKAAFIIILKPIDLKSILKFSMIEVGEGDMTYNQRRGSLGAISLSEKIAYHLWNIECIGGKSESEIKLITKAKWHPQYSMTNLVRYSFMDAIDLLDSSFQEAIITSLDFNPDGEMVATMNQFGVCLISDLSTNTYRFHLDLKTKKGNPFFPLIRSFCSFFMD